VEAGLRKGAVEGAGTLRVAQALNAPAHKERREALFNMELLNRAIPAVKTETADVRALLHARGVNGNGHARVHAHEHVRNGGNGQHRRVRRQIHHGYRRAVRRANTAVMLVEMTGMSVTEAVECCDTNFPYFYAMQALRQSGNVALHNHVLKGDEPPLPAAKRVRNAAMAITAYQKCSALERELVRVATGATADPVTMLLNLTSDQLVAAANALGLDWVWDHMIAAAMPPKPAKTVVAEPATKPMTVTEVKTNA